ncbi:MAG: capsular polysaccharide synthesis protein [Streptococcaceae bacterium]|jgi:hypothetical protein|nr:capsular polysaccharide synthesis protein [Streptococcaceae bacterium]
MTQNRTEQNRTEQNRTEQNRTEIILNVWKSSPNKWLFLCRAFAKIFRRYSLTKPLSIFWMKSYDNYIDKFLRKNFGQIITTDYSKLPTENGAKIVWSIWLQGEENAPELVQKCFESQRIMAKNIGFEHIALSLETLANYLEIPQYILEKYQAGKIIHAHFSDYIRDKLMYEHGGIWLDATCFAYKDLDPAIVTDFDFWNAKNIKISGIISGIHGDILSYYQTNIIAARKGSHLYLAMCQMFEKYFAKENYVSIVYFYMFYFYRLLTTENLEFVKGYHKIPDNNIETSSWKTASSSQFQEILARDTCIYKLTHKQNITPYDEFGNLTFYGELLAGKGLLEQV